jgi:hypothetical protein
VFGNLGDHRRASRVAVGCFVPITRASLAVHATPDIISKKAEEIFQIIRHKDQL